MKTATVINFLALVCLTTAVPRKSLLLRQRQVASCSCDPDVLITQSSVATVTVTDTATTSLDAGTTLVTGDTSTDTFTSYRTTVEEYYDVQETTITRGSRTVTVVAPTSTSTVTIFDPSTTVSTCTAKAYRKRQATGSSAPSTTTITTNFGSPTAPANTCVCRLISAYTPFSSSTTSPATSSCSCTPAQTSTTVVSSTITVTSTATVVISNYETSTITPESSLTITSDVTFTTTSTDTSTTTVPTYTTTTYRTTVTVTTTATQTVNNCPKPDLSCDNRGIRWAIYENTNSAGSDNTNRDKTYSSFDPTVFKNRQPLYSNVTYTLGGFNYPAAQPVYINFYGSPQKFESDYKAINHVGYVFAQLSGTYTFSISKSDDITMLWVGANAYSGWTRANANVVNVYNGGTGSYQMSMVAGNYYPFRIIFGNAQEAIVFQTTLTAPDGTVILTSNSGKSPYLVQYSCDGQYPAFPAFGSET